MKNINTFGMKKGNKDKLAVISLLFFVVICSGFILAAEPFGGGNYVRSFSGNNYNAVGPSLNPQFNNPSFFSSSSFTSTRDYWPDFEKADCYERQDFIMQIAPGGCSPSVVRSDLLEEQNVPVFCKVQAIQTNPLIDVSKIRSLHFDKNYPKGVSSISYFPARAAFRSTTKLVSSPLEDNLGYLVIVLKKQESEREMPEFIEGNVTATIDYDIEGAFGIGNTNFYVNEMNDEEWLRNYKEYSFWNGKGYIRADSVEEDRATISIYRDSDTKQSTITLKKGETSRDLFLGGFYCAAGMNIRLDNIDAPVESALLQINNEQLWVSRRDRFLDGKCRVSELDISAGGGKIELVCSQAGRFSLSLDPGKVRLRNATEVSSEAEEYTVNDKFIFTKNNTEKKIWIGYIGQDALNNDFVVLVRDDFSINKQKFGERGIYSIVSNVIEKEKNSNFVVRKLEGEIKDSIREAYGQKEKLTEEDILILTGDKEGAFGKVLVGAEVVKDEDLGVLVKGDWRIDARDYYEEAIKYYTDLADFYPQEKRIIGDGSSEFYAAEGLLEGARLAKSFGMNAKAYEFYTRLITEYPDSYWANLAINRRELLGRYDSSNSKATVSLNNNQYYIDLLNFKKPTKEDISAVFSVKGKEVDLGLGEIKNLEEDSSSSFKAKSFQVTEIRDEYVKIKYAKSGIGLESSSAKTILLYLDKNKNYKEDLDGTVVELKKINLNKQVKLSITPKAFGPRTESSFNFKIGIEKRAIKLSPEKTKDMIKNMDEQLEKWTDVNEKLGKVVKGLKTACFATSAMFTVKNLFSGFGGEALARKDVMTGSGGWNDKCEGLVNNGIFDTIQECLKKKAPDIKKDVEGYAKRIQEENKKLEKIQDGLNRTKSDWMDFEGSVNPEEVRKRYYEGVEGYEGFKDWYKRNEGKKIKLSNGNEVFISDVVGDKPQNTDLGLMKQLMLRDQMKSEFGVGSVNYNVVNNELSNEAFYSYRRLKDRQETDRLKDLTEIEPYGFENGKNTQTIRMTKANDHIVKKYFNEDENIDQTFSDHIDGKDIVVGLEKSGDYYKIRTMVEVNNETAEYKRDINLFDGSYNLNTQFVRADIKAYENKMDTNGVKVKYFKREPYKDMPAMVPFDIDKGWYVQLSYVLSGFGKPYDESGRAVNFYICNVGKNGKIEYKQSQDDICRYYNGHSNDIDFPGMDSGKSRNLVNRAQDALAQAARQADQKTVRINGASFGSGISFGGEEGRCTDFMSPDDCNILFNVCDPVICPTSRCDLGGKYSVDNVVQSGIIGSLTLCLPNFKEGVMIPICLTGVHAGIEGYISILNSTQACLRESLETGRNIGICDEIKSIYLCEFFWKQAAPFLNVIVPRLIESFYSQGVRGGGEYLTVQSAWDNMEESIDYFKNDYAVNSMNAFQLRSTEDIGTDICKSFTSVNIPTEGLLDKWTEPDSPVQYYAWFSESELTSATIPATSHYKVYYHIYAGNDIGASYVVYIKDLPESSNIHSASTYIVERGYIGKGGTIDEAKDFSAVGGYKQLCISINGQDQCGFGKVSTSYFLNSITDSYATEQAKQANIKNEKECIAGTASLSSIFQPNLQAGAQEVLEPQVYNRGIVRVCATNNPGKQVNDDGTYDNTNSTYDSWKEVGYCDDPTIRCWLKMSSVQDVIKNKDLEDEVLRAVDASVAGLDVTDYIDEKRGLAIANEVDNEIETLSYEDDRNSLNKKIENIVAKIKPLAELSRTNNFRARGVYLFGKLYKKVVEILRHRDTGKENVIKSIIKNNENVENGNKEEQSNENSNQLEGTPKKELTFGDLKKDVVLISEIGSDIRIDAYRLGSNGNSLINYVIGNKAEIIKEYGPNILIEESEIFKGKNYQIKVNSN